jgi:hypothetical protein
MFKNDSGRKNKIGCAVKSDGRIKYEISRLGKMGAASGVRIIDPSTVDLSKYLDK